MKGAPHDNGVKLQLNLRHTHPFGELGPYLRGLDTGRAMAARCTVCERTWFPPRLSCPDHAQGIEWVELPGSGHVVSLTVTQSVLPFSDSDGLRAFALVAVEGAENMALARLQGAPGAFVVGQLVWLSRAPGIWPHPSQAACFVADRPARQTEPAP